MIKRAVNMKGLLKTLIAFLLIFTLYLKASPLVSAQDIFWSTPAPISQSTNYALQPVVTTDSKGYVHAAWMETEGEDGWWNPPSSPNPGIRYSFWNGDTWSTPQQVNSPAQGIAEMPTIAATPDDNIHVVWAENTSVEANQTFRQIYYSRYNGSSWSTPISLSASLHQPNSSWEWAPKITTDTAGNIYVVFSYSDDTVAGRKADLYFTKYNGSGWSTPVDISQNLDVQFPDLGIDSSGNIHVLLWDTHPLANGGIYYTFYNGSVWSPIQQLKTGEAMFPRLVIDGGDNLHAAWLAYDYVGDKITVEYARKPSSSGWSAPFIVSNTVAEPYWWVPLIGITVDSSNNAYVGWGQYNSTWYEDIGFYGVDAMYRKYTPSTNTWSSPNLIRSTKYLDAPTIWRDKWWNQHFAWSEMNPTSGQWEFWYSEVPANTGAYNPSGALTITMAVTTDTIKIPANALATTATISAQVGPVPTSRDPLVTTIPRSYTFRPQGTTFIGGKVATATIKYTDAEVLGSNESQLKAYIWDATMNSGAGGWSSSNPTSVNTNTNRLTVDLPHFSLYGIMAPKAQNVIQFEWRPPISTKDLYAMPDGSTLPIKFTLAYSDRSPIIPSASKDIVLSIGRVVNGEINESSVLEYHYGSGENDIRFDPGNNQYFFNLKTKELNLTPGLYNVTVVYQDVTWGTTTFQLTEPGKVKGATTQ